jgi:hypothetical protein
MTKHCDRGNGFTMCNQRIDERTEFGGGCYYCNLAMDKAIRARAAEREKEKANDTAKEG